MRYAPYTTCYNRFNRWRKAAGIRIWLRNHESMA